MRAVLVGGRGTATRSLGSTGRAPCGRVDDDQGVGAAFVHASRVKRRAGRRTFSAATSGSGARVQKSRLANQLRECSECERKIPGPGFRVRKVAVSELRIPGPGFSIRRNGVCERGQPRRSTPCARLARRSCAAGLDSSQGVQVWNPGGSAARRHRAGRGVAEEQRRLSRC